ATDGQGNPLPASALTWSWIFHHCPPDGACHEHFVQTLVGAAGAIFVAPDHEYPSFLELKLTVTQQSLSATQSVLLYPETIGVTLDSVPSGLTLTLGGSAKVTPFTETMVVGSAHTM